MQTNLAPEYRSTPEGQEAEAILRKCVHCGFCTATCPTYQTLGDELDGPRGRIYLIKQVLEGATPTRATQAHLDRCLTCRNCETTCPSGVQYGHLVDIGRKVVDEKVQRPLGERLKRWALKEGIPSPLFAPAMKLGQAVRPLLPEVLKAKVPPKTEHGAWPTRTHARKVLLLAGCVQPAMLPNINYATARVLDAVGIQTVIADKAGCCGAVKFHLNDQDSARDQMRANIDAWWPAVEAGEVEAIISNASGCGAMVKDYAHALRDDSAYAAKAQRVSALARDLSELLPALLPELADKLAGRAKVPALPMAYHPPCTLQHAQKLKGVVEANLGKLGFQLRTSRTESHLCCGSAGTYSILQSDISQQLRTRKLHALDEAFEGGAPAAILSANIGCITHLQAGTAVPVRHWVEVLDEALV
ncbi:glycolate oxidase subunit GlcF [Comamonas terrigena]|uniref:glycolate oxidase subunit GlcF n=1 Tax=Comamonas terrigena TaxID=32013 RepID=UPI002448ABE9|nr:glycolate oxidase subunit GlcF [Comamonas terrigena]MDH1292964.1 glycolate oxidase subunit GlcF [Comamonas terrigena]